MRFAAALTAIALAAQTQDKGPISISLPQAKVGEPYDQVLFPKDAAQSDPNQAGGASLSFSAPSSVPPGLAVTNSGRLRGTPTQAGNFKMLIPGAVTCVTCHGKTFTTPFTFDASLAVVGAATGGLSLENAALAFQFAEGSREPATQSARVSNRGSQARTVSVAPTTERWLATAGGGNVGPFSSIGIPVTVNPAGLTAGVYTSRVSLAAPGGTESLSTIVVATVTAAQPSLVVSQSGMSLHSEQNVGANPSQTLQVASTGSTPLQFTATVSTTSGGSWLDVSSSSNSTPATITVRTKSASLSTGTYYGQVEIKSDAPNSPRVVNVVYSITTPTGFAPPIMSPAGLILVQRRGAPWPIGSVTVTNVSAQPLGVTVTTAHDGPTTWLSVPSLSGPIPPGQSGTLQLIRDPNAKLAAGVHQAEMVFRFSNGAVRGAAVVLVIQPGADAYGPVPLRAPALAEGCAPTKLLPVFTTLGTGFSVTAAWPSAIEMRVVDDCGDPMTRGTATVAFSNGDPPLAMTPTGDGRWSGTWQPRTGAQNVVLIASAQSAGTPTLNGASQIGGAAASNVAVPVVSPGGVLGAASFAKQAPVAPGAYVAVFGQAMASGLSVSPTLPLAQDLAGTQAILAGRRLPLQFTSDGQINAVIPYDIPPNAPHQLVVRRGNMLSMPEPVVVAAAQPAVFTKNQTGKGEGIVVGVKADGSQFLVSRETPVVAGDVLVVYSAGLGAVNPPVTAGAAAPSDPLARTTNPVTVTVGGKSAQVLFAGLSPGLAGIYQVNAVAPDGVAPGEEVVLVLTVAGQSSPPVTIAVASLVP